MTKYWEKKQEGYLFRRCPKEDQDPTVQDGRFVREWTFADKSGQTLGYKTQSFQGFVESAWASDLGETLFFNIGFQDTDGEVNVLQTKLYGGDTLTICQALRGIDLEAIVKVETYLNKKKAYTNKYGNHIVPAVLHLSQNGKGIKWTFPWNAETKSFDGLPDIEVKMGGAKKDSSKREAVFDTEIEDFVNRVEEIKEFRQSQRAPTQAEIRKAQEDSVVTSGVAAQEEECPF